MSAFGAVTQSLEVERLKVYHKGSNPEILTKLMELSMYISKRELVMKEAFLILVSFCALVLSSCAMIIPGPSAESAALVRSLAKSYQGGAGELPPTGKRRSPLKPGQWVAILNSSKKNANDVSLSIMKVSSVQESEVTLELETYAASGDAARQVLSQTIQNYPMNVAFDSDPEKLAEVTKDMRLAKVKMMDVAGDILELPSFALGIANVGLDHVSHLVAVSNLSKEACRTSTISSSACYRLSFRSNSMLGSSEGTTYAHSSVPVLGYLLSETDDMRSEVVGFGASGARILIR